MTPATLDPASPNSPTASSSITVSNLVTSNLAERRNKSSPAPLSIKSMEPGEFDFSKPVRPPTFDAAKHETALTRTIQNKNPRDTFVLYRKGNEIFWSQSGVRPIEERPVVQLLGMLLWNEQGAFAPWPTNVVAFRCTDGVLRQITGNEVENATDKSFVDFDGDHRCVKTLEVLSDDKMKTLYFQVVATDELPQAEVVDIKMAPESPRLLDAPGSPKYVSRRPPTPAAQSPKYVPTSPTYAPGSPQYVSNPY